jgi:hypothetical protein
VAATYELKIIFLWKKVKIIQFNEVEHARSRP